MEIKTCEAYVINELNEAKDYICDLETENEVLDSDIARLHKDIDDLKEELRKVAVILRKHYSDDKFSLNVWKEYDKEDFEFLKGLIDCE